MLYNDCRAHERHKCGSRFSHHSQSASCAAICSGMKSPKKRPTGAKLRNGRVAIMRLRAQQIGTVAALDRAAAQAEAVKAFDLSEDQRERLMVWERE